MNSAYLAKCIVRPSVGPFGNGAHSSSGGRGRSLRPSACAKMPAVALLPGAVAAAANVLVRANI